MKLPKARGGPGRQVGAGQLREVDPDLGARPWPAVRLPGGAAERTAAGTKWRQPSRVSTASVTPQTASRVAQAAVRWETRGSGGWAQRALGYAVDPGRDAEIPQNGQAGNLPELTQEPGFGRFTVALASDFAAEVGASGREASSPDKVAPGRRSPSSGGSPRVRFPGQENQYQPAATVGRGACRSRPGWGMSTW